MKDQRIAEAIRVGDIMRAQTIDGVAQQTDDAKQLVRQVASRLGVPEDLITVEGAPPPPAFGSFAGDS